MRLQLFTVNNRPSCTPLTPRKRFSSLDSYSTLWQQDVLRCPKGRVNLRSYVSNCTIRPRENVRKVRQKSQERKYFMLEYFLFYYASKVQKLKKVFYVRMFFSYITHACKLENEVFYVRIFSPIIHSRRKTLSLYIPRKENSILSFHLNKSDSIYPYLESFSPSMLLS